MVDRFDDARCDSVLAEVLEERRRQDATWGQQDHPWVRRWGELAPLDYRMPPESVAKALVQVERAAGLSTYAGILVEEVVEAVAAQTLTSVRAELVQVAAVAVAAVESIDRRAGR